MMRSNLPLARLRNCSAIGASTSTTVVGPGIVSGSIGAASGTTTVVVGIASSPGAVAGSELAGRTAVAAGISGAAVDCGFGVGVGCAAEAGGGSTAAGSSLPPGLHPLRAADSDWVLMSVRLESTSRRSAALSIRRVWRAPSAPSLAGKALLPLHSSEEAVWLGALNLFPPRTSPSPLHA